jgi:hypothetical protein
LPKLSKCSRASTCSMVNPTICWRRAGNANSWIPSLIVHTGGCHCSQPVRHSSVAGHSWPHVEGKT